MGLYDKNRNYLLFISNTVFSLDIPGNRLIIENTKKNIEYLLFCKQVIQPYI